MPSAYLLVGRAVGVWGLQGGVKVKPYAASLDLAEGLPAIYLGDLEGPPTPYDLEWVRRVGSCWVVKLRGIDSPAEARRLVGHEVSIPRSAAPPLPGGTYYHGDLIGLAVRSEAGRALGQIVEIIETGANDVYVVRGHEGEVLIPATREVVRCIDLAAGTMIIRPLEGMIEPEAV